MRDEMREGWMSCKRRSGGAVALSGLTGGRSRAASADGMASLSTTSSERSAGRPSGGGFGVEAW